MKTNPSLFSRLPHRVVVPIRPYRRRATPAQLGVSFLLALPIVAVVTVVLYVLKGCRP